MLQERLEMSERQACRVTGQARSTQRRSPRCERPDDPDRWLRDWLNEWANTDGNARKGYRRAWADLRYEHGHIINKKRVHRIWREEGLQVAKRRRRKRVGESTGPIIDADAPNVVWAIDFQHDSTADGRGFKIASMVDEHTRESLLDVTARSITGCSITSNGLLMPPDQKSFQTESIWLLISPVIVNAAPVYLAVERVAVRSRSASHLSDLSMLRAAF